MPPGLIADGVTSILALIKGKQALLHRNLNLPRTKKGASDLKEWNWIEGFGKEVVWDLWQCVTVKKHVDMAAIC